jgi:hypothetical protein
MFIKIILKVNNMKTKQTQYLNLTDSEIDELMLKTYTEASKKPAFANEYPVYGDWLNSQNGKDARTKIVEKASKGDKAWSMVLDIVKGVTDSILDKSKGGNQTTDPAPKITEKPKGLSPVAIAGLVLGGLIVAGVLVFLAVRKGKNVKQ